jgi:hypothetical protein
MDLRRFRGCQSGGDVSPGAAFDAAFDTARFGRLQPVPRQIAARGPPVARARRSAAPVSPRLPGAGAVVGPVGGSTIPPKTIGRTRSTLGAVVPMRGDGGARDAKPARGRCRCPIRCACTKSKATTWRIWYTTAHVPPLADVSRGQVPALSQDHAQAVRIDGDPRQKHVAVIASHQESKIDNIGTRSAFWCKARERLDHIGNQITPADRSKVEAELARRVPPTTPAEDAEVRRQTEESMQEDITAPALATVVRGQGADNKCGVSGDMLSVKNAMRSLPK